MSSGCETPLLVDDWFRDYTTLYIFIYWGLFHNPIEGSQQKPTRIQWNERGILNTAQMMSGFPEMVALWMDGLQCDNPIQMDDLNNTASLGYAQNGFVILCQLVGFQKIFKAHFSFIFRASSHRPIQLWSCVCFRAHIIEIENKWKSRPRPVKAK